MKDGQLQLTNLKLSYQLELVADCCRRGRTRGLTNDFVTYSSGILQFGSIARSHFYHMAEKK